MTPEKEARVQIDLGAGLSIAVREFPLATGFADYLHYAEGGAIGVVEAKPDGFPLKVVSIGEKAKR